MIELMGGIYARRSQSGDSFSPENQVELCQHHALIVAERLSRQRGQQVIINIPDDRIFIDQGKSGRTLDRTQYYYLRDVIANQGLDILFIYATNRLGRLENAEDMLNERRFLIDHGVTAWCQNRDYEITTADEGTIIRFFFEALEAKRQWEDIRKVTMENRWKAWERDSERWAFGGPLPFGYWLDRKKHVVVEPEERSIWLKFQDWVLSRNYSLREVARQANLEGIPAPRQLLSERRARAEEKELDPAWSNFRWTASTVRRVLTNPIHMGAGIAKTVTDNIGKKQHINIPAPAITTPEKWHAIQRVLGHRKRTRRREYFYLLKDVLKCMECHKPFVCLTSGRRGRTVYSCQTRIYANTWNVPKCRMPMIATNHLEPPIWNDVKSFLERKDAIRHAFERGTTQQMSGVLKRVTQNETQLTDKQRALERLTQNWAEVGDSVGIDALKASAERYMAQIEELEKEKTTLQFYQAMLSQQKTRLNELMSIQASALDKLNPDAKLSLVQELIDRAEITLVGKREVEVQVHYYLFDAIIAEHVSWHSASYTLNTEPISVSI